MHSRLAGLHSSSPGAKHPESPDAGAARMPNAVLEVTLVCSLAEGRTDTARSQLEQVQAFTQDAPGFPASPSQSCSQTEQHSTWGESRF